MTLFFFFRALLSSSLPVRAPMPPGGPPPPAAPPPGAGALGEALIPTINRLHDIFSTVRKRLERESGGEREERRSARGMRRFGGAGCAHARVGQRGRLQLLWPETSLGADPVGMACQRCSEWPKATPAQGRTGGAGDGKGLRALRSRSVMLLSPLSAPHTGRPRSPGRPAPGRCRRCPERGQVQRAGVAGK